MRQTVVLKMLIPTIPIFTGPCCHCNQLSTASYKLGNILCLKVEAQFTKRYILNLPGSEGRTILRGQL
jgi:hypothetical protein